MTQPTYAEVVERLVRVTSQRDALQATLRALAEAEGDTSLVHLCALWRQQSEQFGMRMALAERLVRRLLEGGPHAHELEEWQAVSREQGAA